MIPHAIVWFGVVQLSPMVLFEDYCFLGCESVLSGIDDLEESPGFMFRVLE
jgi:hypothetical protein